MPQTNPAATVSAHPLRRFLPYLWPEGQRRLKARVIAAIMLVLLAKATVLTMPFAYKGAIDRMAPGMEPGVAIAVALILAYAAARFGRSEEHPSALPSLMRISSAVFCLKNKKNHKR